MKDKLFLFYIVIIGLIISVPTGVFAKETKHTFRYDIDVDYKFNIEGNTRDDLEFTLRDMTNTFVFNSSYNPSDNMYYFNVSSTSSFSSYNEDFFNYLSSLNYTDDLQGRECNNPDLEDFDAISNFNFSYNNLPKSTYDENYFSAYTIVPMILEETSGANYKKIVFASIHLINYDYCSLSSTTYLYYDNIKHYIEFTLTNDLEHEKTYESGGDRYYLGHNIYHLVNEKWANPLRKEKNVDNINFMKNSVFDYSDGLWEALNSNRIASPEINDFVEEYISSHPEEDIIDNDSPNIVNPNTLANAFVVLFILLIITISSSFIIVKNKKSIS